jgi:hypothetical protein
MRNGALAQFAVSEVTPASAGDSRFGRNPPQEIAG